MKRLLIVMLLGFAGCGARAQGIESIVGIIVDKVVRAVDLHVQQLQTKTIVLQDAEEVLQNVMSELRLDEIAEWLEDQRDLYSEYFQELAQVKTVIADYHRVQEIIQRQKAILAAYQRAMALFRNDPHFTASELGEMVAVYGNILAESGKNLALLATMLESAVTSMTDQDRLSVIDGAGAGMDREWQNIQLFTDQNELLAMQRARDVNDYETLKKLYGL